MKDWKGELLFPQMLMILENDNLKAYGLHEDMLYDLMIPHYGKGHVCTGYSNDFLDVTEVMKVVEYASITSDTVPGRIVTSTTMKK
jgi:hypothetical protein